MSSFVSPDEQFLMFASAAPGSDHVGNGDLYITYRRAGRWTEPRNLGRSVNSFANEYGPTLSPDGTYLHITSDRHPPANIYRVKKSTLPGFDD